MCLQNTPRIKILSHCILDWRSKIKERVVGLWFTAQEKKKKNDEFCLVCVSANLRCEVRNELNWLVRSLNTSKSTWVWFWVGWAGIYSLDGTWTDIEDDEIQGILISSSFLIYGYRDRQSSLKTGQKSMSNHHRSFRCSSYSIDCDDGPSPVWLLFVLRK